MKKGPYDLVSSKVMYENPWIKVREDRIVRPNGDKGLYGVVEYGKGVATVALNSDKKVFLVKEYCYAVERDDISLPGGGIEKNEKPIDAAKRELLEEAGVESEEWIELGYVDPYTMIMNAPVYLFLALNAKHVKKGSREFTLYQHPFNDVVKMVMESKISHAGSVAAILKAQTYLKTHK